MSMNLDGFVLKYLGKKIDFDNAYAGQCVDLFRQYVQEVLQYPQPKGVTGAADFWTNYNTDPNLKNFYQKIPNTPTGIPQKGDVMLWNKKVGGGFGHVSIFLEGDANEFTSFDQNWPTLSVCTKTVHDYKNTYGWLRPNEPEIATPLPSTGKIFTQEEYDKVRLERDDNWNKLQAEISDHQKDLDDIAVAAGSSNTRSGILARIGVWEDEKEAARKATNALQDEVDTLNTEKQDHLKRIDDLQKAIEQQRLDNELKVSGLVDQLDILREKITQTQTKQNWLDQVLSYFKRK